jgi:nucleoside-diphosphate-sugar epimerase
MNSYYFGKHVLITGGAGYLASSIVAQLLDIECQIVRLDRPGAAFIPVQGRARILDRFGDIRDRATWEDLLLGVDIVMHFAAQTSAPVAEQNLLADLNLNVVPMIHLLETCREKAIHPTILFSGTVTETGLPSILPVNEDHLDRPITVYDLHKWFAENYLLHYAQSGVIYGSVLRLANVYGPGPKSSSADRGVLNMMIRKALRGEPLTIYGDGKFLRDYVYIEDVARAFLVAAANIDDLSGHYFVIGSGHGYTISDAIHLVAYLVKKKTGRDVPVLHVEPPASLSPIETRNFIADSNRFMKATMWEARMSLTAGIEHTIDYFLTLEGRS